MENNRELKENYRRVGALLKRKFIRGNNPDTQQKVLGILAQNDGITQKELSGMLGIRPQSGGEIVRKLENNGYVERIPDENDSRAQRLHLTEAGIKENEKLNRQAEQEDQAQVPIDEQGGQHAQDGEHRPAYEHADGERHRKLQLIDVGGDARDEARGPEGVHLLL